MRDGGGYVKRPLLLVGAAFFVTLWFLTTFGQRWFVIAVPAALSLVGFGMISVHKTRALVLLATFLSVAAACLFFLNYEKDYSFCQNVFTGKQRSVVGQVCEKEEYLYGTQCVVKLSDVDGNDANCKLFVNFKDIPPQEFELYEEIEFCADISAFDKKSSSYTNRMKSEGIYLVGSCSQKVINHTGKVSRGVLYYINKIKSGICSAVTDFIPNDNGKLIIAYALGDKSELSEDVKQGFRICGISHLMAVSGLHVYTWSHALFVCLIGFISRRKAAISSMAFTLFFMALTGFSPSVVRAGIMMMFVYLGYIFLKVPDSLNSLGAALLLLCAFNPFVVHNISFQLSFSAAFGLSLMSEKVSGIEFDFKRFEIVGKILQFVCRLAAVCIVATVFTLPAAVFSFGRVSLIGVVANVICVDVSMFIMIIGAIGAVLSALRWTRSIGLPLLLAAGFLSKIIIGVVKFLSRFDYLYVDVDYPQVRICVAVLVIAAALLFVFKPDIYKNKFAVALTALNLTLVSLIVVNTVSLLRG